MGWFFFFERAIIVAHHEFFPAFHIHENQVREAGYLYKWGRF
jgi:hypothetical protein